MPVLIFSLLAMASVAWLMHEGRVLTFIQDEWTWLLFRRGHSLAVFLKPHAEHLSALPIFVYKAFFAIFGARSTVPFRLLVAVLGACCSALLFVLAGRRVGRWLALFGASILLFFGPGWNDLVWGFQSGYLGSLTTGFGALLLLERQDRRGDVIATLLLTASVASSSVGVMILVGAAVELVIVLRRLRSTRWLVVAVPAALYLLWYSRYGVSSVQLGLAHTIPLWTFQGLAASAGSITGLASPSPNGPLSVTLDPGTTIAMLLLVALGARLIRGAALSPRFWAMAAATLAFWSADALSAGAGRSPEASRYTYPVSMFLLLAIAEFCSGMRVSRRGLTVLGVASIAAIASNLGFLREGAKSFALESVYDRAELGAMQVARPVISPSFSPAEPAITSLITDHLLSPIQAGAYFSATDKFGSPADSVSEILRQSEAVRDAADLVLYRAERLALMPGRVPGHGCSTLPATGSGTELALGAGTIVLRQLRSGVSAVLLRRFGGSYDYDSLGAIAPRRTVALALPADRSSLPWHVRILSRSAVTACRL